MAVFPAWADVLKADANLSSIPVIALTSNAMPRDIERGRAAGFREYLTKPLDLRNFLYTLDHYLSRNDQQARMPDADTDCVSDLRS